MAHYLFNYVESGSADASTMREQASARMRLGMWGVDAGEPHRDALAAGDLVLVYLGAPVREFVGRAELASAAHDWTPTEADAYPADSPGGVLLAQAEEWSPPASMSAVLSRLASPTARADFETGVVLISAHEYETALAVAATRTDAD